MSSDEVDPMPPAIVESAATTPPADVTFDISHNPSVLNRLMRPFAKPFPHELLKHVCKAAYDLKHTATLLAFQRTSTAGWDLATPFIHRRVLLTKPSDYESYFCLAVNSRASLYTYLSAEVPVVEAIQRMLMDWRIGSRWDRYWRSARYVNQLEIAVAPPIHILSAIELTFRISGLQSTQKLVWPNLCHVILHDVMASLYLDPKQPEQTNPLLAPGIFMRPRHICIRRPIEVPVDDDPVNEDDTEEVSDDESETESTFHNIAVYQASLFLGMLSPNIQIHVHNCTPFLVAFGRPFFGVTRFYLQRIAADAMFDDFIDEDRCSRNGTLGAILADSVIKGVHLVGRSSPCAEEQDRTTRAIDSIRRSWRRQIRECFIEDQAEGWGEGLEEGQVEKEVQALDSKTFVHLSDDVDPCPVCNGT